MKKTFRIKKNYEFKRIFTKGQFFGGKILNIYIEKSKKNYNKFGVAISKKVGKSVIRNKLKRWGREVYKNNFNHIKNDESFNMIIVFKNNFDFSSINYHFIQTEFIDICQRAGLWNNEEDIN